MENSTDDIMNWKPTLEQIRRLWNAVNLLRNMNEHRDADTLEILREDLIRIYEGKASAPVKYEPIQDVPDVFDVLNECETEILLGTDLTIFKKTDKRIIRISKIPFESADKIQKFKNYKCWFKRSKTESGKCVYDIHYIEEVPEDFSKDDVRLRIYEAYKNDKRPYLCSM